MITIRTFVHRFRLLGSLTALAVLLAALATNPARAEEGNCERGCWSWNALRGCVDCHVCCVDGAFYNCNTVVDDNDCGTGGPGIHD